MAATPSNPTQFRSLQIAHSVDYAVCPPPDGDAKPHRLLALHGWEQNYEKISPWVTPLAEPGFRGF